MSYDKYVFRKKRLKLGLSQQEVSDRAGIHLKQYQRFENGERELSGASLTVAYGVLKALEMDVDKYIAGEYEIKELIYRAHDGLLYNMETDEPIAFSQRGV